MKRDMDLVRTILLTAESAARPDDIEVEGQDVRAIAHHIEILDDAGFVEPDILYSEEGPIRAGVRRLTWEGHEFLDAVRDDTVWQRTQDRIRSTVGTAAIEAWKATAEAITRGLLGLN